MRQIHINQVADSARFNGFHANVLFWCFLVIVIDGYDIAISGAALPSIMSEMGVDATTAGFMASSALFGMMFGAIFLGALADRIGRRWTIALCVFLFSVFTAAAGLTNDPYSFSVMRFIAGLGIGGVMPNIVAQMTEFAPRRIRSFMTTAMFSGYAIGGILAALIGKQFIADYGWQIVFFAAGVPVLLIPFVLKFMPESMAVLAHQKKEQELRKVVAALDPDLKLSARNQLWGDITRISDGTVNAEVTLTVPGGKTVCAVVTHQSVQRLGLAVGGRACAVFKASSVILCQYA